MTKKAEDLKHFLQSLQTPALTPDVRADQLMWAVTTHGTDTRPALVSLIKDADEGRKLKAEAEEAAGNPIARETLIGRFYHEGRLYAYITLGHGETGVPCQEEQLKDLVRGDPVLVDTKTLRLVGRDGAFPHPGEVVAVESLPAKLPGHVVVRHHEQKVLARLSDHCADGEERVRPGSNVVFDPVGKFVHTVLETKTDGADLLVDPASLTSVGRADLGAPNPILEEILFRLKMWVKHADWMKLMRARLRMSYLFVGPTGTGKTMLLKVLARELSDFVFELTGERVSRLVMCDASSFYTPLFGATEERIVNWFDKLKTLGKLVLRGKDGREIRVPLMVVLEEVEALVRGRGEVGGSSHLFDRPLSLILQKLDALTNDLDVPLIFCSTTNRADLIDPAARRRLGVRQVNFGTLNAGQAHSVLDKKLPHDLPLRGAEGQSPAERRMAAMSKVIGYLFGNEPEQGVCEARLVNNERRTLCRRDLVTGAMIEQAVSTAIDEAIRQSAEADELLGVDGEAVVRSLQAQFATLATTLRPHNLREHCPEMFTEESIRIDEVRPLVRRARRPRALLMR